MPEDGPNNPMRAAQANMRPKPVKRFYKSVEVREAEGRHTLALDGRLARTPGRNPLSSPSRPLMLRVAEEWTRQRETLDPGDMPLNRLLNAALDGVSRTMEETRAEIQGYAGSDLLCYRAAELESLAERQRPAFDPVLDWATRVLGARFVLAAGVTHVEQPPETLAAVEAALKQVEDPAALAALAVVTTLTGSALLALATAAGFLSAAEAWRAAHIDEDFQNKIWGVDQEAFARRAQRWREMEAAAVVLDAFASRW